MNPSLMKMTPMMGGGMDSVRILFSIVLIYLRRVGRTISNLASAIHSDLKTQAKQLPFAMLDHMATLISSKT